MKARPELGSLRLEVVTVGEAGDDSEADVASPEVPGRLGPRILAHVPLAEAEEHRALDAAGFLGHHAAAEGMLDTAGHGGAERGDQELLLDDPAVLFVKEAHVEKPPVAGLLVLRLASVGPHTKSRGRRVARDARWRHGILARPHRDHGVNAAVPHDGDSVEGGLLALHLDEEV